MKSEKEVSVFLFSRNMSEKRYSLRWVICTGQAEMKITQIHDNQASIHIKQNPS